MRLSWSTAALDDRGRIYHRIEEENQAAAIKLDDKLVASSRLLLDYPNRGRVGRQKGTRELVVHPNYILVYQADREEIVILRVLHAARRWP